MAENKNNHDVNLNNDIQKQLNDLLSNPNIHKAVIIYETNDSDGPRVYRKGHFYDIAVMITEISDAYKTKVVTDLNLNIMQS